MPRRQAVPTDPTQLARHSSQAPQHLGLIVSPASSAAAPPPLKTHRWRPQQTQTKRRGQRKAAVPARWPRSRLLFMGQPAPYTHQQCSPRWLRTAAPRLQPQAAAATPLEAAAAEVRLNVSTTHSSSSTLWRHFCPQRPPTRHLPEAAPQLSICWPLSEAAAAVAFRSPSSPTACPPAAAATPLVPQRQEVRGPRRWERRHQALASRGLLFTMCRC